MKNGIIPNSGKHGYFNVTAITDKGSPVSTQVWAKDGNPSGAANAALGWFHDGERDKGKLHAWNSVICVVFIHSTATGETYKYDLGVRSDFEALGKMANQISPAA